MRVLSLRMHSRQETVLPLSTPLYGVWTTAVAKALGFWRDSVRGVNSAPRGCNKLRKHAVRSWETRELNASEEPGSARWPEGCLVSRKVDFQNSVQQIFGRPDAKSPAVCCI